MENNAFGKFGSKINTAKGLTTEQYVLKSSSAENLIFEAFSWSSTPDGSDYWIKLHDKWKTHIRGKNYKESNSVKQYDSIW